MNSKKSKKFSKWLLNVTIGMVLAIEGLGGFSKFDSPERDLKNDFYSTNSRQNSQLNLQSKVDDWNSTVLSQKDESVTPANYPLKTKGIGIKAAAKRGLGFNQPVAPNRLLKMEAKRVGFSVGGAKDFTNFIENIKNGYLPLPESITYEGVFYQHRFKLPDRKCRQLFCPAVERAIQIDPFSGQKNYYLSVGLSSNLSEGDLKRPPLDLVVVLDVSGSMSSKLNEYYYDKRQKIFAFFHGDMVNSSTKIEEAKRALIGIIDQLKPEDRLGIVLFDHRAYPVKPLRKVGKTDLFAIKRHIRKEVTARGGTNWELGYNTALEYFKHLPKTEGRERRIIFITDAMPNTGKISEGDLLYLIKKASQQEIWTTFVGVGLDFNPKLVEYVSKVPGANYLFIRNNRAFQKRLVEQFDYLMTPLVFNLDMKFYSNSFQLLKSYGTASNGQQRSLIHIDTLFPSPTDEEGTKGGIILLQLKPISNRKGNREIWRQLEGKLEVTYRDRKGYIHNSITPFKFDKNQPFADSKSIEKGILLVNFVNLMKNWLIAANSYYLFKEQNWKDRDSKINFSQERAGKMGRFTSWEDSDSRPYSEHQKGINPNYSDKNGKREKGEGQLLKISTLKGLEKCFSRYSLLTPPTQIRCIIPSNGENNSSYPSNLQIPIPDGYTLWGLSKWERSSKKLIVPPPFNRQIPRFSNYFYRKAIQIGDKTLLEVEYPILKRLSISNR